MEAKKITIACFVGGVLCTAVPLMFTPMFWWLGLLAGMAGGYLGYEFREVLEAIPVAWRKSRRGVSTWWTETDEKVKNWSSDSHPLLYSWIISMIMMILGMAVCDSFKEETFLPFARTGFFGSFILTLFFAELSLLCAIPFLLLIIAFSFIGARVGEKCFWFPFIMIGEGAEETKEVETEKLKLERKGYHRANLTGKNFFRWFVKGIGLSIYLTILFFVWMGWKYLFTGIWLALCFSRRFGWELFKLIHSKKRVLCAIDGTIGGAMAFFCFASASLTFPQQILVVFFGGLLGAMIGVLNYEIVSKRVLHLVPVANNI